MNPTFLAYKSRPIRVLQDSGLIWFALSDVAEILETPDLMAATDSFDHEAMRVVETGTSVEAQEVLFLSRKALRQIAIDHSDDRFLEFYRWAAAQAELLDTQHGQAGTLAVLKPKRAPAQPPLERHLYKSVRCNVCLSPQVHRIDQMLIGNVLKQDGSRFTFEDIQEWARLHGVSVSKAGLSRHKTEHLMPRLPAQVAAEKPRAAGLEGMLEGMVRDAVKEVLGDMVTRKVKLMRAQPVDAVGDDASDGAETADQPALHVAARATAKRPSARKRPSAPHAGTGRKALPRDFREALKLEAALNDVQLLPVGMRAPRLRELAAGYGVDLRTAQRWLSQYEQHGLAGITRVQRGDKGSLRLPPGHVRQLGEFVALHSNLSPRKIYALIEMKQPELLEYSSRSGSARKISLPSLRKIIQQVRNSSAELDDQDGPQVQSP